MSAVAVLLASQLHCCAPRSLHLPACLHACRKKPLTLLPLIALIFFEVSGGPFGTEVCVELQLSCSLFPAGRTWAGPA